MSDHRSPTFVRRCVSELLAGLSDGLTHFSGRSRAALVFALRPDSPLLLCDPQNLLRGHEPIFRKLFLEDTSWRQGAASIGPHAFTTLSPTRDPGLTGLLSYGGCSGAVFFQQWFTEQHPDLCSRGPTLCWLEHAAWLFAQDIANGESLYTGISGRFLKEYGLHAVRDYIIDQMNVLLGWDSPVRIYPVLEAMLLISETREERAWAKGKLLVIDPSQQDQLDFLVHFRDQEQPRLAHIKHVRKLLQTVEQSSRYLVSDGRVILGICSDRRLPRFSLCAEFAGQYGFLSINRRKICSFTDGRFGSTTYQANLVHLEELLLEIDLDENVRHYLFKIVSSLVHHVRTRKYGATIVVDCNPTPLRLSGQVLSPPINLLLPHMLNLTKSLTRVDGALHIGADLHLHGFACLLDGRSFSGEDLARGARYNSGLRFTAEHEHIIVIVSSVDNPVSVMYRGMDLLGSSEVTRPPGCVYGVHRLQDWVQGG
ncbi:MAG: DNA integrity scanning protein DisA nucleotide-binding domain protein [Desulfobulbus sp.]|jgi:hypothetical protein